MCYFSLTKRMSAKRNGNTHIPVSISSFNEKAHWRRMYTYFVHKKNTRSPPWHPTKGTPSERWMKLFTCAPDDSVIFFLVYRCAKQKYPFSFLPTIVNLFFYFSRYFICFSKHTGEHSVDCTFFNTLCIYFITHSRQYWNQ